VTLKARVVGYPHGDVAAGVLTLTPVGGVPARVPWSAVLRPPESLLGPLQLSSSAFAPSEVRPAVLSLTAGRVRPLEKGEAVEPVLRLDIELWTDRGKRLGVLTRVRDLLPGRYAFGLTGRGPGGKLLKPGRYRLRVFAWPTGGGRQSSRSIPFSIR
jgi:hypothetical protein